MRPTGAPQRLLLRARILGCLIVAMLLIALTGAHPAAAAGHSRFGPFSVTPVPSSSGKARPYFSLDLAPGKTARDAAVIANGTDHTLRLRLSTATGVTATNSGSAFTGAFRACAESGCWINGLPKTLTIPAGSRKTVSFTVHAPAHTAPGQYLAGITVEPTTPSKRKVLKKNKKGSVGAVIIHQATVGVAVTIGSPATLTTRLEVGQVTATMLGDLPRLGVPVHNTGRTFTKSHGRVICGTGHAKHTYPITSDTILPGDTATLPVNATGLQPGSSVPCTIRLSYGAKAASWSGTVTIPGAHHTTSVHVGKGAYAHVPDRGIPTWAIILLILGAVILALLIGIAAWLARQHHETSSTL